MKVGSEPSLFLFEKMAIKQGTACMKIVEQPFEVLKPGVDVRMEAAGAAVEIGLECDDGIDDAVHIAEKRGKEENRNMCGGKKTGEQTAPFQAGKKLTRFFSVQDKQCAQRRGHGAGFFGRVHQPDSCAGDERQEKSARAQKTKRRNNSRRRKKNQQHCHDIITAVKNKCRRDGCNKRRKQQGRRAENTAQQQQYDDERTSVKHGHKAQRDLVQIGVAFLPAQPCRDQRRIDQVRVK